MLMDIDRAREIQYLIKKLIIENDNDMQYVNSEDTVAYEQALSFKDKFLE